MGNNPRLPNIQAIMAMGINPKTGLPYKMGGSKVTLKEDIKKTLRILDEQNAVNRYVWYNLPCDLTSQEVEKMLYYRGQLCFFYDKDLEKFFFTAYALDGTIDAYGRYNTIRPVPFTSGSEDEQKRSKLIADYFSKKQLKPVYGVKTETSIEDIENSAVILHDYTRQLSQQIIPRCTLNEPILDVMSDCVPMMRTSLLLGTGVKGVRVQDADQAASVEDASRSMERAALTSDPFVPVVGNVDFQELTDGQLAKAEEYMLAMQSLDNLRLGTYGIENGGLFQKNSHLLQTEADMNGGPVGLVLQDGLSIRQHFCNVVNSIYGLGIWCEPAESIVGADLDGDGVMYDRDEVGENSGVEAEPASEGGEENE